MYCMWWSSYMQPGKQTRASAPLAISYSDVHMYVCIGNQSTINQSTINQSINQSISQSISQSVTPPIQSKEREGEKLKQAERVLNHSLGDARPGLGITPRIEPDRTGSSRIDIGIFEAEAESEAGAPQRSAGRERGGGREGREQLS